MAMKPNKMALEKWNTAEQTAFLNQLYELMSFCAARCTGGDSTSLPRETAQELLSGLLFVLGTPNPGMNLRQQYENGLKTLNQKMNSAKKLWREVCLIAPNLENFALRDTLREIGGFFSRYDPLFAHEIRCMIDYPLCRPVSETLRGVDYIADYLLSLKIEFEFINAFPAKNVQVLLRACCMDLREQLVNLYEPVAVNALGLALVGADPRELDISDHERQKIARLLSNVDWKAAFEQAVCQVLTSMNLHSVKAESYLLACARALLPRIKTAIEAGDLSWIFLSASEPARLSMRGR